MRHHGGVATACIHGFAPGTCLICQTLDAAPEAAPPKRTAAARQASVALNPSPAPRPSRLRTGPRVVPKEAPRTSVSAVFKLTMLAVAVIAVIVVAWTVLHIVFAVLHILELIGVAIVCGYLGWVAGVHHGHRTARRG
jgi:hypothetical protein